MNAPSIACGIVAPVAFWIAYLYYKDRYQPEPAWAMGLAYVLGLGAAYAVTWGYELSVMVGLPDDPFVLARTDRLGFLVYAVGFVGVFEEGVKMLVFSAVLLRLCAFDEVIDGIIYASALALGYATVENLLYLPQMEGGAQMARAFAAPLVHAMFSSVWGYMLARAKIHRRSKLRAGLMGLVFAAVIHGLYDYVALDPTLQPLAAVVIGGVWIWRIRLVERLHAEQRRDLREKRMAAPA